MTRGLACVALAATSCFNPSYNEPSCGPHGECPSGLVCQVATCVTPTTSSTIDARAIDARAIDARAIDARPVDAHVCPPTFTAITGAPTGSVYVVYGYSSDQSATFATASAMCTSSGGYLAIPDTQNELDALNEAVPQQNTDATTDGFWVGLTDAATEGTWLTVKGTAATFLPWGPGQPNGGTSANCAIGYGSAALPNELYDEACSEVLPFACECEP